MYLENTENAKIGKRKNATWKWKQAGFKMLKELDLQMFNGEDNTFNMFFRLQGYTQTPRTLIKCVLKCILGD